MQQNNCIDIKRRSLRKTANTNDSAGIHVSYQAELLKELPAGGNSILTRRKLHTGFSLNPIHINQKTKKYSSSNLNKLLGEMKLKVSTCETQLSSSCSHKDVEYIFINPANNSPKQKSKKELRIDSFLNDLGIFQVNISVALNDYKF